MLRHVLFTGLAHLILIFHNFRPSFSRSHSLLSYPVNYDNDRALCLSTRLNLCFLYIISRNLKCNECKNKSRCLAKWRKRNYFLFINSSSACSFHSEFHEKIYYSFYPAFLFKFQIISRQQWSCLGSVLFILIFQCFMYWINEDEWIVLDVY